MHSKFRGNDIDSDGAPHRINGNQYCSTHVVGSTALAGKNVPVGCGSRPSHGRGKEGALRAP